ncbi:Uncharacterized conserved protein YecE, DUF72 family [Nakamurella panacisegetis]|uniref:Uncharacterized conserved protein YecE, DUF72 family n=1 Tax=Nakamurella panacisegetis TaxID=1090615 RepID=A0A1H0ST96_9ACTN|nr:DUF72 domain-containing protein [Nakamurella panacisegetis]SDP44972.1 Uncharacterized conserved protein YecE, DUF72 family [Nakamurella panacisegetis]
MTAYIGTSGWSYDHWIDVLYPRTASSRGRLDHYLREFSTVELNSSFYHWPRDSTFAGWKSRLPPGFAFAVKAPRGLTHAKKLRDPEVWIERLRTGLHELGDRRGPLLVQLAPQQQRDDARLEYFLSKVPPWIRVAVEFRHQSWLDDSVFALLERHGAAYCVMSGAGLPCVLRATASFVYVRLHGPDHEHLYGGSYSDDDLQWWAARIRQWRQDGREVFAYFNNDGGGNAVRNARYLRDLTREM